MTIFRLLRSDWLKMKRTPLRWAIIIAPFGYALIFLWYFSTYQITSDLQYKIYRDFFEALAVLMPLVISVVTSLFCLQEEQAGSFSVVLGSPISKPLIYVNKLGMMIAVQAGCMLISVTTLLLGMKFWLNIDSIDAILFYKGTVFTLIGTLPLLTLHLWLSFAYGIGASVGTGGIGFLVAAIIGATSVGDRIWPVVPWAWPVRISINPNDPVVLTNGIVSSILLFVILAILSSLWFHRWEGRKQEEA